MVILIVRGIRQLESQPEMQAMLKEMAAQHWQNGWIHHYPFLKGLNSSHKCIAHQFFNIYSC